MDAPYFHFQIGAWGGTVLFDFEYAHAANELIVGPDPGELAALAEEFAFDPEAIPVGYNNLLLRRGDQVVLVDAGIRRPTGRLLTALSALRIDSGQVGSLILTHTDRDHIGGILDEAGEIAFRNAEYILLDEIWAHWSTPQRRQALTEMNGWEPEKTATIWETLAKVQERVRVVQPGEAFLPGFQLLPCIGHRHDHSILKVTSEGQVFIHLADTLAHPLFVRQPGWVSTYDSDPAQAAAARARALALCAREDALVFGPHFPFPGLGRVRAGFTGFSWQPIAS